VSTITRHWSLFRANVIQSQFSDLIYNVVYSVNAVKIFIVLPTQNTAPGTTYRIVYVTAYSCNVIRFLENHYQGVASNVGIGVAMYDVLAFNYIDSVQVNTAV